MVSQIPAVGAGLLGWARNLKKQLISGLLTRSSIRPSYRALRMRLSVTSPGDLRLYAQEVRPWIRNAMAYGYRSTQTAHFGSGPMKSAGNWRGSTRRCGRPKNVPVKFQAEDSEVAISLGSLYWLPKEAAPTELHYLRISPRSSFWSQLQVPQKNPMFSIWTVSKSLGGSLFFGFQLVCRWFSSTDCFQKFYRPNFTSNPCSRKLLQRQCFMWRYSTILGSMYSSSLSWLINQDPCFGTTPPAMMDGYIIQRPVKDWHTHTHMWPELGFYWLDSQCVGCGRQSRFIGMIDDIL